MLIMHSLIIDLLLHILGILHNDMFDMLSGQHYIAGVKICVISDLSCRCQLD
jgi:hypothetical protein